MVESLLVKDMNRIKLLSLLLVCTLSAYAQLNGSGYYRVQNTTTQRYITVIDGYGSANLTGRSVDSKALRTVSPFDLVASDPSSIIYVDVKRTTSVGFECDLLGQGINSYSFFSKSLMVFDNEDNTYKAYASKSGVTMYLYDKVYSPWYTGDTTIGEVSALENTDGQGMDWYIIPINSSNYFGVRPDITVGSDYYKSFCASFPFTIQSSGVTAYTISKVVESKGVAIIKEVSGTVAGGTPLIFKCSSTEPSDNILNIVDKPVTGKKPIKSSGNQLTGVYFCNTNKYYDDGSDNPHFDAVPYDASTMRVLGTSSDGKLAFIKASYLEYIPANSAYITVSSNAPDVLYVTDKEPESIPGDVSGDGTVDGQDLVLATNHILNNTYVAAADLNNDGVVNGTDYVLLVNKILGK